jgi:hypothetical protein
LPPGQATAVPDQSGAQIHSWLATHIALWLKLALALPHPVTGKREDAILLFPWKLAAMLRRERRWTPRSLQRRALLNPY